jgi:GTPase SAR1 family protein
MYYRGAAAAVVVFDLTDSRSFEGAKSWVEELHKQGNQDIVLALVGNKKDLPDRKVQSNVGKFFERNNFCFLKIFQDC